MSSLPDRFYLTGTDTDVGKTVTAALLCAALGYDYWKPVQAGLEHPTDTELVAKLSGARVFPERYALKRPASPHAAADDEGLRLALDDFQIPDSPRLVVEGAGGLMVPYAHNPVLWQSELIRHLGLPVVVVARSGLGTLNHTFLTLRALAADSIPCAGVIFVGEEHVENSRDINVLGGVRVWARIDPMADLQRDFSAQVSKLRSVL